MNQKIPLIVALNLVIFTPLTLLGGEKIVIEMENVKRTQDRSLNRFSIGPQFSFNYKADFQNSALYYNPVDPGPAIGGANHIYNDGYVLVDGSGNFGGLTGYWGYVNPSQVVGPGNGTGMAFHAIQSGGSSSAEDNPQYGFEIVYQRVLGDLPTESPGIWGFQAGFSYTDLDLHGRGRGTTPVTIDTYPLNGVLPPLAPYNGTFLGPGALLGDTPVRTLGSAALVSDQTLSGDLFAFRFGPFVEWDLTPKLSLSASVGVTLAPTKLEYDFSETATLASGASFSNSGHSSDTEILYGAYVDARLRYAYSENWGVYVGAQFQSLNSMQQSAGGRSARFDPGATFALSTGIIWRF
jgi:hypothetical protein